MAEDTARTGETVITTDHDTIRHWIEECGSTAAQVTEPAEDDPGSLAVVPKGTIDNSIREVSWKEFFAIFEDEELAFVYHSDKDDPDKQWSCKFIDRTEMDESVTATETTGTSVGMSSTEAAEIDADARDTENEAMDEGAVDEDEIVAGETTSRGTIDEEAIGDQPDEEVRAEDDDVANEPAERMPVEEETGVPPDETDNADPAEPLESKSEPTDTTEREPLESGIDTGQSEPIETSTEAEGVNAEPIESESVDSEIEPTDPGEPSAEREIPTDREPPESEPTEPAETDIGGEPIESGSVEGSGTNIGGEPIDPDGATGELEAEPGTDKTDDGSDDPGVGIIDLTAKDEGKAVVDETGDHLGIVSDVEEETIRVNPDSELTDDRMSELGWDDHERETHRVENDRIRKVTITEVVIFRL